MTRRARNGEVRCLSRVRRQVLENGKRDLADVGARERGIAKVDEDRPETVASVVLLHEAFDLEGRRDPHRRGHGYSQGASKFRSLKATRVPPQQLQRTAGVAQVGYDVTLQGSIRPMLVRGRTLPFAQILCSVFQERGYDFSQTIFLLPMILFTYELQVH